MNSRRFLHKLLNVRPTEWKVVSQLFWLQFFMGTGIAFFFTASFSHFLEKFSASQVAWVMIVSSPLLFFTGWVFNKFEHRMHLTRVGTIVIIMLSLIHISEPTRLLSISYAVFCLKTKKS